MSPSERAIENLIAAYAALADNGDFAGVGALFEDAVLHGASGPAGGARGVEAMLTENLIVYEDGTPRTKHLSTNVQIEVDEANGTAIARSYFTVLQALRDLPLQAIVSGRYEDRFVRRGGAWRFAERRVHSDLVGDISRHVRGAAAGR
jgi:3-phenylpropionate/cinnamic acid dioxygenase small subunit